MHHPSFGMRKVCEWYWYKRHSTVLCRHLGYPGVKEWSERRDVSGAAFIDPYNVQCTGSESSIWECAKNEWRKVSSCKNDRLLYVSCG